MNIYCIIPNRCAPHFIRKSSFSSLMIWAYFHNFMFQITLPRSLRYGYFHSKYLLYCVINATFHFNDHLSQVNWVNITKIVSLIDEEAFWGHLRHLHCIWTYIINVHLKKAHTHCTSIRDNTVHKLGVSSLYANCGSLIITLKINHCDWWINFMLCYLVNLVLLKNLPIFYIYIVYL